MRKFLFFGFFMGVLAWAYPTTVKAQCAPCQPPPDPPNPRFCAADPSQNNCPNPPDETSNCGCDWFEDFESNATGTLDCVNGWQGWACNDAVRGEITNEIPDHTTGSGVSVAIDSNTDQVHRFFPSNGGTYTGGNLEGDGQGYDPDVSTFWVFKAWSFVPLGHGGNSFLIMLSRYSDTGGITWNLELIMDATSLTDADQAGPELPLALDQWVPFEVQINFDTDTALVFYNNIFFNGFTWTSHVGGDPEDLVLTALDLFNSSGSRVYWDDISMTASAPPPINRPGLECLTAGLDQDRCADFLWRITNLNLDGNIAQFYLDIEAGAGGRNSTCRGGGSSTVAITPPAGWTATNCTGWGSGADGGHVVFRLDANSALDEIVPGQQIGGRLTVDTNLGQEVTTTNSGVTVPPFAIVMSAAQRSGNEASLACSSGDYSFGPTVDPTLQQWGSPTTCTAFLNAPALSPWSKALLAMLLLGGGALLVLRSRRAVTA